MKIYLDIRKRLPCRLVSDDRIQLGLERAITSLEKRNAQGRPF